MFDRVSIKKMEKPKLKPFKESCKKKVLNMKEAGQIQASNGI
jgi:hypothetical protein